MNSAIILLLFLSAGVLPAAAQKSGPPAGEEDDHVRVSVAASRDTLPQGSGADLLFTFSPKKGYHVNAVPPMAVRFDSASPAVAHGEIAIPADSVTGYLRSALPVRRPFRLAPEARRGRAELKGVLTYYYCSDAEGWCRKENLPFALKVTVK